MQKNLMRMSPPWIEPRTAYLHIPFCAHHCGYCDFAVAAGQDHLITLYLEALKLELSWLEQPRPVESLFIGGGTPTYLNPDQLRRLMELVHKWLPLVQPSDAQLPHDPEFSIESTPDSLDDEKAALLAALGVNRISIGVQSFRPESLTALDRRHTSDQVPRAVEVVRQHVPSFSFDLIFGAPGSTPASWASDLRAAVEYEPKHISTYGLTYEKGTPLWKQRSRGQIAVVMEDDELTMYEHAIDTLTEAGYEHYEISNFAQPGWRCRHNERYWANEAYYGFGVGAARYIGGRRMTNVRDTRLYIKRVLAGEPPTMQEECLGPRERAFETIGTQLRRIEGINLARFHEQTGFELQELVGAQLAHLTTIGLLAAANGSIALTRRGKCLSDGVIENLMKAL